LISNAIKYTPEGGEVEISAELAGGPATGTSSGGKRESGRESRRGGARRGERHLAITVRDTGIGIPKKDLGRIFERFYRVDKARSRSMGGTGLGLSIAREIVRAHGGVIAIDSEVGKGTTVTVRLPLVRSVRSGAGAGAATAGSAGAEKHPPAADALFPEPNAPVPAAHAKAADPRASAAPLREGSELP